MRTIDITAKDGAAIPAVVFNADSDTFKGVVIVSYGFGEHHEMYTELALCLGQGGYAVILYDLRGHGAPPDDRKNWFGVIKSYQSFLDDLASVTEAARQMAPGMPIVLYGHSMGGNIVLNLLLRSSSEYACAVLESPWLGLSLKLSPLLLGMAKLMGAISANATTVNKLVVSDLSSDPARAEGYTTDPLYHNRISFRMFNGIINGCAFALENAAKLPVPVFMAYAKNERIVSNEAALRFAAKAGEKVTVMEYESCHAIHNDVKLEELFRDVIAFLDEHCAAYPGSG